MRASVCALLVVGLLYPALAQAAEPSGCDKFKWPIAHEQSAVSAPQIARIESGAVLKLDAAASLRLSPFAETKFEMPPERAPKTSPSYAGVIKLDAPGAAGTYKVTISAEGWIDVIQDGHFIKPTAFSGATDCQGVRKSVKFPIEAKPITIQLSNAPAPDISLIVSPE
jgi:hypothetical protein